MIRGIMQQLGMIDNPNRPNRRSDTPESLGELTIKQWVDSAGAFHTGLYDENNHELDDWYALTKTGAHRHARVARKHARKYLKERAKGKDSHGWEFTGDRLRPKKREFKVK